MFKKDSKNPSECKNLEEIRVEIDSIDRQIIQLIAKRGEFVKEAAKFKTSETAVRDEERVKKVIESKKQLAIEYNISPELIGDIYNKMIGYFVNKEIEEWQKQKS